MTNPLRKTPLRKDGELVLTDRQIVFQLQGGNLIDPEDPAFGSEEGKLTVWKKKQTMMGFCGLCTEAPNRTNVLSEARHADMLTEIEFNNLDIGKSMFYE